MAPNLILASSSPFRQELLARLNLPFKVISPDIDESALNGEKPEETALRLAQLKAKKSQKPTLKHSSLDVTKSQL